MGTPVSLAMFAALVAAITVVAGMTVVGALALLYYSSGEAPPGTDETTHLHLPRDLTLAAASLPPDLRRTPQPPPSTELYPSDSATRIDTPRIGRLVAAFEEDEGSLSQDIAPFGQAAWDRGQHRPVRAPSRFQGTLRAGVPASDAAFGTPGWTEEEGATEIFSAHNLGDMSEFAFVDDEGQARR